MKEKKIEKNNGKSLKIPVRHAGHIHCYDLEQLV